jgi:hypothetical protein
MRTCLAVAALAVAGLLAAGCSSGPAPGASNAAGTSDGGAGANAGPNAKSLYISCLVSHGMHIPPPGAGHDDSAANRNSPQDRRAEQACRSLQPPSAPVITAKDQADYLRAAQCMRSHSVPDFPDPVFSDGGVHFPGPPAGLNIHSPQVLRAEAICRRLIPRGLPDSR